MESKDSISPKIPLSPLSPSNGNSSSSNASPLTRRRIQEAIETDSDTNYNISSSSPSSPNTIFTSSSPRRKLQQALQKDVDVGEVKEVSSNFYYNIIKNVTEKMC